MGNQTLLKSRFLHDSGFWNKKRVVVTGGSGFLGRHLVERLEHFGAKVFVPRSRDFNLIHFENAERCLKEFQPEVVIHSAAYYGGLGITMREPGKIYFDNLQMGTNVMEASRRSGVKKFVSVGTACSYPGYLDTPMDEEQMWTGPVHDSVIGYGTVKKMLHVQGIAYRRQFGLNAIYLVPTNLYGPFDSFDPYRSHVVSALIRKFYEACRNGQDVTVWGTGAAVREFLYIEDCADGILLAAEKYDDSAPLNIGTGIGTSIRELVETIAKASGFSGQIHWDTSRPDGQPIRILDITKMKSVLGWQPRTSLTQGIQQSLRWYEKNAETLYPMKTAA